MTDAQHSVAIGLGWLVFWMVVLAVLGDLRAVVGVDAWAGGRATDHADGALDVGASSPLATSARRRPRRVARPHPARRALRKRFWNSGCRTFRDGTHLPNPGGGKRDSGDVAVIELPAELWAVGI